MRISIVLAAGLFAGAGATTAGALTVPNPYFGSDVLFNVTNGAIAGAGLTPTSAFVGGGTSTGQAVVATRTAASATQQTEPIANIFTSPICQYGLATGAAGTNTNNATGIVVGLDAVAVLASTASGAAPAVNGAAGPSGDNTGTGLAYSGSAVFGSGGNATNAQQNWKYVLALVYGGKDITTGVVDCAQAARLAVVNNWAALFPERVGQSTRGDLRRLEPQQLHGRSERPLARVPPRRRGGREQRLRAAAHADTEQLPAGQQRLRYQPVLAMRSTGTAAPQTTTGAIASFGVTTSGRALAVTIGPAVDLRDR